MTDLRAAAQQALEALEWHYHQGHSNTLGGLRLKIDEKALRKLRAALAEPEPPPEAQTDAEKIAYCAGWWDALAKAREGALAEPVQEPVAWQWLDTGTFRKKLPKTAERCAWNPLYAAPPQRPPLTDEEIKNAVENCGIDTKFIPRTCVLVARAIEQAHGIGSKT